MITKTEIGNISLMHLGHSTPIGDVELEETGTARAIRFFYDFALKAVLRDFNWPFAKTIQTMSLTQDSPGEHWDYAYQYPVNCSRFIKIQSGVRNDSRYTKIPYEVARGQSGKIILTDKQNAVCEFTFKETNPAKYDDDFILALSWRLAVYIAPSVTGGDPFKLKKDAMQMYQYELGIAKENALNEMVDDDEAPSEFELSRI